MKSYLDIFNLTFAFVTSAGTGIFTEVSIFASGSMKSWM